MPRIRPLHKIGAILVAIVLLPVTFYSVYEINTLKGNRALAGEIYRQQLETILFSINQYAWDMANGWANRIELLAERHAGSPEALPEAPFVAFLGNQPAIQAIFLSDSSLSRIQTMVRQEKAVSLQSVQSEIQKSLAGNRELIRRLIRYKDNVGYKKLEPLQLSPGPASDGHAIALVFLPDHSAEKHLIAGIVISPQRFIQTNLRPKLEEVAGDKFLLAAFEGDSEQPVFATDSVRADIIKQKRNIWLFPNQFLGIALKGTSIEMLTSEQFYSNLYLILFVDAILLIGVALVYRNIRREMRLAQMKSEFVSNVSHELKTPLALIRMFAETLQLDRVPSEEKKRQYYEIMSQETERLTHLVNNILDFSRMEAGKKEFVMEELDLNPVVNSIVRAYEYHLQSKGFDLSLKLSARLLPVLADADAIREAILNLIDNAIKYSPSVKWIELRTGIEGKLVYVEVADKGEGIPSSELENIFDKFYRVSDSLTHNTKGSGLGLSLVKHIVEAHKGRISVESNPGKGSCFRVSLPAAAHPKGANHATHTGG